MDDRFWRMWGTLRHARSLSFSEAVSIFSLVKLGSDLGILPRIGNREWRQMVLEAQRYHMGSDNQYIAEQAEEPHIRAARFGQFIEGKSSSIVGSSG